MNLDGKARDLNSRYVASLNNDPAEEAWPWYFLYKAIVAGFISVLLVMARVGFLGRPGGLSTSP